MLVLQILDLNGLNLDVPIALEVLLPSIKFLAQGLYIKPLLRASNDSSALRVNLGIGLRILDLKQAMLPFLFFGDIVGLVLQYLDGLESVLDRVSHCVDIFAYFELELSLLGVFDILVHLKNLLLLCYHL